MAKQKHKNMMEETDVKEMIREYWETLEVEVEKDFTQKPKTGKRGF